MILTKIRLKNFLSHKNTEVNLQKTPVLLSGPNGAGKSSIFDGVTAALFRRARGTDAKGAGIDSLIRTGTNGFHIEVDFILDEATYTVKLSKDRNRSALHELWKDNVLIASATTSATNIVSNLLKMDYDSFVSSVFLVQGQSGFFFEKKASDRKQILMMLLGLSEFEQLEKKAKETRKGFDRKLDYHKGVFNTASSFLINKKESLFKFPIIKEISEDELKQTKDKVNHLTKEKQGSDTIATQISTKLELLNKELQELSNQNITVPITLKQIEDLRDHSIQQQSLLDQQLDQQAKLKKQLQEIIFRGQTADKKLKNLQGVNGSCPTCLQTVDSIMQESLKQIIEFDLKTCKTEYVKLKDQIEELDSVVIPLEQALERVLSHLNNDETQYKIQQALGDITKKIVDKKNEVQILQTTQEGLQKTQKVIERELQTVQTQLLEQTKQYNEYTFLKKQKEQLTAEVEQLTEQAQNNQAKIQKFEQERNYYDILSDAFAPSGIPTLIISKTLPVLEHYTNYILETLSDGIFRLRFEISESGLDVHIIGVDGEQRPYEIHSSGERYRIDLALRYALTKLVQSRFGMKIQTLLIDEGMGSLDEQGKNAFAKFIKIVSKEFSKVLVVSHLSEIQDLFENRICLSNGSIVK